MIISQTNPVPREHSRDCSAGGKFKILNQPHCLVLKKCQLYLCPELDSLDLIAHVTFIIIGGLTIENCKISYRYDTIITGIFWNRIWHTAANAVHVCSVLRVEEVYINVTPFTLYDCIYIFCMETTSNICLYLVYFMKNAVNFLFIEIHASWSRGFLCGPMSQFRSRVKVYRNSYFSHDIWNEFL